MKNFKLLWLVMSYILTTVCLTACSDENESTNESKDDIVGVWESVSTKYIEKVDGKITMQEENEDNESRFQFKADGTFVDYELWEGDWDISKTGTWSYQNGTLTLIDPDEEYEDEQVKRYTVTTLTNDILVLEFHEKGLDKIGRVYESHKTANFRRISK